MIYRTKELEALIEQALENGTIDSENPKDWSEEQLRAMSRAFSRAFGKPAKKKPAAGKPRTSERAPKPKKKAPPKPKKPRGELRKQSDAIAALFDGASASVNRDGTADVDADVTTSMGSRNWFDTINTIESIPYKHWWYRFRLMLEPKESDGYQLVYKISDPVKGLKQGKPNAWRRTKKAGAFGPSARLFIKKMRKRYRISAISLEISKSKTQKQPDRQ